MLKIHPPGNAALGDLRPGHSQSRHQKCANKSRASDATRHHGVLTDSCSARVLTAGRPRTPRPGPSSPPHRPSSPVRVSPVPPAALSSASCHTPVGRLRACWLRSPAISDSTGDARSHRSARRAGACFRAMDALGPRCCGVESGNARRLLLRHGSGWLRFAGLGIPAAPLLPRAGIIMGLPDCMRRGVGRTEATICSRQRRAGVSLG